MEINSTSKNENSIEQLKNSPIYNKLYETRKRIQPDSGILYNTDNAVRDIIEAISNLKDRLVLIENHVSELHSLLRMQGKRLRELSHDDAKKEALEFFKVKPNHYASDCALALNLSPVVIKAIVDELISNGQIIEDFYGRLSAT